MPKQQWPATVKVAWWEEQPTGAGQSQSALPIEIGYGEVAVLLAIQPQIVNTGASDEGAAMWLYRQSEPGTKRSGWSSYGGYWQQDTNVIDYTRGTVLANTSLLAYKVYPYPVILIRPPSIIYATSSVDLIMSLGLWYVLQKVTEKEMSELMVKDHA